ncbi:Pisatin demethylase [Chaetomidium leptoderma]|uniref:Pisatin demethylase n=1 Tax=Chaetomidium leptoderma TaxID=669021 RepID=A0AAN6ZZ30_9PEZI|nr:Pisatin demethylase [Chaetomidium leptoderma]
MLYTASAAGPAALLGLALVVLSVVILRVKGFARLKHIPGPLWAGWTDLWLIRAQICGRLNFILHDVNRQYGKLFPIGPKWVVCGDGAELRRMWGVRSAWQRAYWYRGLRVDPYKDNAFSTLDDQVHEKLRAKLAPGYGGKDVDNLHQLIDEQVAGLVSLLETTYLSTEIDFRPVDLACKAFGYLAADVDLFGYIETTERTVPVLLATALMPWFLRILQSPRLKWLLPNAQDMVGIGTVMGRAKAAVAERYGDKPVVKRDMLGSFVAHGLSREDAEGETVAEIDAGIREGRVSSPITDAEARQLPYLQAVIREGLRVWPPATAVLPKVSDKDQVVCGVRVPAGTNFAWSPWSIMRNKETFGDDADLFRPERWLGIPPAKYRLMDQTVMMEFAPGSRWECLGKTVAQMELNKTFVELLRRFDFTLLDPTSPWKSYNAAVFIQSDMNVVVTRREPSLVPAQLKE